MKKHVLKSLFFAPLMLIGMSASAQSSTTIPQFTSPEEKQQWISEHQEEYNKIQNASAPQNTVTNNEPAKVIEHAPVPASFPVYVNTGNKEKDDADYSAAKLAWIEAHPVEYAEMINPKN